MNKEIETFVTDNPDWFIEDDQLTAGFEFTDFSVTKKMVEAIMGLAIEHDHHPNVTFGYNTLEIKTVTHDAGNQITEKDFALAKAISKVVSG